MDAEGSCGAVAALEHIAHPISVARRVMERTPHVLLAGDGALEFAMEQGFPKEESADAGIRQGLARVAEEFALPARRQQRDARLRQLGTARRQEQSRHAGHARDRCAGPPRRRVHHQRHGVEAARARGRFADHRRGAVRRRQGRRGDLHRRRRGSDPQRRQLPRRRADAPGPFAAGRVPRSRAAHPRQEAADREGPPGRLPRHERARRSRRMGDPARFQLRGLRCREPQNACCHPRASTHA